MELSMKQPYFAKFDPHINKVIGCPRTTIILGTLEYWFSKKVDGFYKFIEPCAHRLYKEGDSWAEHLGCNRKSFSKSFNKIGVRYTSRTAFLKADDKFQGKMYASYYDRYTNRTFFIRNHDAANEFLNGIHPTKTIAPKNVGEEASTLDLLNPIKPVSNGKFSRSYIETKNTSKNLSKDKSHAEEIIKKMIEIWTALVEESRDQVKLSRTTVPFLKKAFTDKFDSCLDKWKKYCNDIASSRFLMGEKNSFKAKLDWALMFKNIEKVLDGQYGIGDRAPKAILISQDELQEEIITSEETQEIKDFRILCLKTVGNANYISNFKKLRVEFREEGEVFLIAPHKFGADFLEQNCYSYLRLILQGLEKNLTRISILAPGETKGRIIERKREWDATPSLSPISMVEHSKAEEFFMEEIVLGDESLPEISVETRILREKLCNAIPPQQFPSWLANIEVEGINEDGMIIVSLEEQHVVDYCKVHFRQQILLCASELWQNVKYLIIQEKFDGLNGFEPIAFQNIVQKTQNFPDCKSIKDDAAFLLSMAESGEGAILEDEPLPEISEETQALRTKLRYTIPPKQFPSWLWDIEVEGVRQDGTIVVTFEDQLIVDYCMVRFNKEIFQSATSLWKDVNRVVISQKLANGVSSVEKPLEVLENIKEKSILEQALQSLLSVCSPIKSMGALRTVETCPVFG
jgi:hypothetical protein